MKKILILILLVIPFIGFSQYRPAPLSSTQLGDLLGSYLNYDLPTSDGTANQVLTTDGGGTITWETPATVSALQDLKFNSISDLMVISSVDTSHISLGHIHEYYRFGLTPVISVASSTYTISDKFEYGIISVEYTTTGAVTITLPAAKLGITIVIKDAGGNASVNNITVSGGTIDGAASLVINGDYSGAELYSNGTNWFIKYILP